MPVAAPKPCAKCGVLVYGGPARCAAHRAAPGTFADRHRGSRHERGYGSAWDRKRLEILARDGGVCQCETCKLIERVRLATQVDHRISKAEWLRIHGSLDGVDDDSNLQAINVDCHKAKTAREATQARARTGPARRG